MKLYSTNKKSPKVSFKEAILKGLADDGGLYMPEKIPKLSEDFFKNLNPLTPITEIGFQVSKAFFENEIPDNDLQKIVEDAINFDAPLIETKIDLPGKNYPIYCLELFHGPTLAFKDFGARFMARLMSYFRKNQEITILVATSGDTGSAVASGFLQVPGFRVILLYPSQKVSQIQEQQLTTMGHNITALEIEGTFDDCQQLVKRAFVDHDLQKLNLSSANSINIARLIPQSFYYFYAYAQLPEHQIAPIFSVPSGNFGNLTAGLIANKMGLPVSKFIAAVNANNIFPHYLESGNFEPKPSVKTISNAMDVGNPSNFARIMELYEHNLTKMREEIWSKSFNDDETKAAIKEIYTKYGYLMDPHGAVAYLGIRDYMKESLPAPAIFLETAHPSKFLDVVEPIIGKKIKIPARLSECLKKEKKSLKMAADFDKFKEYLLSR